MTGVIFNSNNEVVLDILEESITFDTGDWANTDFVGSDINGTIYAAFRSGGDWGTLIPADFSFFIAGFIILFSSDPKSPFSPACGFSPVIAILGFLILEYLVLIKIYYL